MGRRGNPADAQASHHIGRASHITQQTGLPRHIVTRNDKSVWIATL